MKVVKPILKSLTALFVNSAFRNKMTMAGAGSRDVVKRPWKDLMDHIKIEVGGL